MQSKVTQAAPAAQRRGLRLRQQQQLQPPHATATHDTNKSTARKLTVTQAAPAARMRVPRLHQQQRLQQPHVAAAHPPARSQGSRQPWQQQQQQQQQQQLTTHINPLRAAEGRLMI
jgi:hypothetical protein